MAEAQLMEEQLQQSVLQSEREAGLADGDITMGDDSAMASQSHIDVASPPGDDFEDSHGEDEDMVNGQEDPTGDHDHSSSNSEEEEEEEEEADDDDESDDAFEEDDGEGEEKVVSRNRHVHRRTKPRRREDDNEDEDEDEDEDEGVGAVKIKPGETDEDDDSDSDHSADEGSGSDNEDSDAEEWDAADADEADEDEEDNVEGHCVFCKQDEEHDPAEEFEVFLACVKCGDNAHQQCARDNKALNAQNGPENWKCLKCADTESDVEMDIDGITDASAPPSARRANAPKLARDLLPSPKGTFKPNAHSVYNQLVLDEDPLDGSRVLRKRKTSSIEPPDEHVMALRKRRRNTTDEPSNDDATSGREGSSRPVSRSLRIKIPSYSASITKRSRNSIIVKLRVNSTDLGQILSQKPRGNKKRSGRSATSRRTGRSGRTARSGRSGRRPRRADANGAMEVAALPIATPFTTTSYSQPFYSFYDKETDELKGKPYGGILTEAEADTSKTMPTPEDRRRFDEAKQQAEEEWRQRLLKMQAEVEVPAKRTKKTAGPASQIECIEFGGWEIDTWYAAPYPEEYSRNRVLYICEFCLKYMNSDYVAWRHKLKCPAKHPPGDEIYRHNSVSVFEVDGRKNPVYCQNLCLLAKLFLGSKTLYYDVEPFLFYVLCEYDDLGYHFVGYFSKEKRGCSQNNVSCILTLPIHQRKGYGNLLIDFSYLLTRVEQKTGSPEKPLSDMGLVSYRNYWRLIMCKYLLEHWSDDEPQKKGLSIRKISDDTGLTPDDVISALEGLRCLVRDPQTQLYAFRVDLQYCREYVAKWEAKKYVRLNESALTWTPYVMGRSNATNFELGPALTAIAPREQDEEKPTVAGENLANGTTTSFAISEAASQDVKPILDTDILESTESPSEPDNPAENRDMVHEDSKSSDNNGIQDEDHKPNGILVNGDSQDQKPEADTETAQEKPDDWILQYKDIPPSRFEVVPPITGARRTDRARVAVARTPVVRTSSSVARPRPKRAGGGRRSTASRPRASTNTNKRKPGGTGRGPGRWPKGTKKSDYGGAGSGPGLPPAWVAARQQRQADGKKGNDSESNTEIHDTVQVHSPDETKGKSMDVLMGNIDINGTGSE
ncbi:putative histone acetyltransferase [Podospora australis]|uniref:Histone acetyltransferase n=1 Tax=Podospora australis TaxID=1536484 RepID=A0AAN7AJE4_9PEZI|nr:putative histone acetyltransferase [Podospora australis]